MKNLLRFIIVVAVVGGTAILLMNQLGKSNNAQVSIGESTKFSEVEINEAVSKVKRKFWGFRGCELTEIWYTEAESDKIAEDYLNYGDGSEKNIDKDNVIGLLSNFKVDSSGGDGSLEPNSTYTEWRWVLIRNSENGKWHVKDWGY
ncbi:DUF4829 domain-containing protein [Ureibacillus chungkukjangi]|uniref:DUF4829 domain-containing protein n=1 Tax=Ureibacillus chungkukjangi TaxID=1202712 RepID=A0A318U8U9_9BACL|nr:DUF4829 domain-containing protein [Ureibacillus chungkukjangi]PYF08429.1 hypothetical protein BJ095_102195 [Ureibacillus chungkukjangi]